MSISPSAGTPCGCWAGIEEQEPFSTKLSWTEASFKSLPTSQSSPLGNLGFLQNPGPGQRERGADRVPDQSRESFRGWRSESSGGGTLEVGGNTLLHPFPLSAGKTEGKVSQWLKGLMAEWMYVQRERSFVLEL